MQGIPAGHGIRVALVTASYFGVLALLYGVRFFLYQHWIFSGQTRVRAALRSRRQVWTAARANRTPVAEVPALLRLGRVRAAVAHRRRDLGQAEAVQRRADHQLGRLVLGLLERHRCRDLGTHRAQPARGIGDPMTDQHADQRAEHEHARVAHASVVSSAPRRREPDTKSARPSRIGCTDPGDLLGLVLPVGVDRADHLRAARAREPVAEPQRRALPAVDRHVTDERASRGGLRGGAVASPVDDDDRLGRESGRLRRDLGHDLR